MRRSIGRTVVAVFLVCVGYIFSQVVAGVFSALLAGENEMATYVLYTVLSVALYIGFLVLAAWVEQVGVGAYGLPFRSRDGGQLLLGLGIGIVAFGLVCLPLYLSGTYSLDRGAGGADDLVVGLVFFISVGIVEEFLCRGFLQHRLRSTGAIPALLLTAVIFAALHLNNSGLTLLALVNLFLAGVFMGSVMYATGSLYAAVGVHITWNWFQGSVLGIPVSGSDINGYMITGMGGSDWLTGGEFGAEGSIACTIVLIVLSGALLYYAHRRGKLAEFAEKTN